MNKQEFLELNGHDPIMRSCREDSDIFNRMLLAGFKFVQPWNSLVYHLTGRGAGSFGGDEERHKKWQFEMQNSTKEFIRKWGTSVKHTALMKPIVIPKYDIGIILKSQNIKLLNLLEPWCSTIYADPYMIQDFIQNEQKYTTCNLNDRIKPYDNEKQNEILVQIDESKFTKEDYKLIELLPEIIQDSGKIGEFNIGNLVISIIQMNEYQNELIICPKLLDILK